MNTTKATPTRPPLETLACFNERCEAYGQVGRHNLPIRKIYGKDQIRYLRCRYCGDERHGYAHDQSQPQWEAEVIDPVSKFVVSHVQGQRDKALIRRLLEDAARRLAHRHRLVLLTDGKASYANLFLEIFGQAHCPSRQGDLGRFPNVRYHIPYTLADVQIVKRRAGQRVVGVALRYVHGLMRCVQRVLEPLGYTTPNTSAIERCNGTARRMNAHQVRRSLAFSRRDDTKVALGW
jgi:IS1 family transposase